MGQQQSFCQPCLALKSKKVLLCRFSVLLCTGLCMPACLDLQLVSFEAVDANKATMHGDAA